MDSPTSEQSQEPKSGLVSVLETLGRIVSYVTNVLFICTVIFGILGAIFSFIVASPLIPFVILVLAVVLPIWAIRRWKKRRQQKDASERPELAALALADGQGAEKPAMLLLPSVQTGQHANFEEQSKSDQ